MRIDLHAHVFRPRFLAALGPSSVQLDFIKKLGCSAPYPEVLLPEMERYGIDAAVLSLPAAPPLDIATNVARHVHVDTEGSRQP